MNITKAQRALFNLIGRNLFSAPMDLDNNVELREVIKESAAQSVTLLAFKDYRNLLMDGELSARLKKELKKQTASNLSCVYAHKYVHDLMTKNGIPYSILRVRHRRIITLSRCCGIWETSIFTLRSIISIAPAICFWRKDLLPRKQITLIAI